VQAKEGGNVELKSLVTHNLGDGVRSITEWMKLPMGSCKAFFLQVQPNFIFHLKLVWQTMLIMMLFVLGIGLMKNILNLLADVMDSFNEPRGFFSFGLSMGQFFLCGHKEWCNIHGTQWLKSQPHLKGDVAG
jgi:hypothetical protein